MMFSSQVFLSGSMHSWPASAVSHYALTLRLLQQQINDSQDGIIPDSTIMVVIMLAEVAELMGDPDGAANHVGGLARMVSLRGELKALTVHNNMQVKVCR